MRVLVVEDNPDFLKLIHRTLTQHGFVVDTADRGYSAERLTNRTSYDALVLDRMLPDCDGLDMCASLRRQGATVPILMLTGLSATADKVSGLDAGADDYLTKPFSSEELVARLRTLLRRGMACESSILKFEDIELDLTKQAAARGGRDIKLTRTQFHVLEYFVRNHDRALTNAQIAEHVWLDGANASRNAIEFHISVLRRRLNMGREQPILHTIVGVGYILSSDPQYVRSD